MDIETLHIIAIRCFERIRTKCIFLRIYTYGEEDGNLAFYGLYKCKRRFVVRKVILTFNGEFIAIITL